MNPRGGLHPCGGQLGVGWQGWAGRQPLETADGPSWFLGIAQSCTPTPSHSLSKSEGGSPPPLQPQLEAL